MADDLPLLRGAACTSGGPEKKPEQPNAHVASAVGHAAFGLAGHQIENGPIADPQLPGRRRPAIWPTYGAEVRYPPARILAGDSEMQSLAVPQKWVEPGKGH